MILGDLLHHQQTDAGTLGSFGREKVLENLCIDVFRNPGSVVFDFENGHAIPIGAAAHGDRVAVLVVRGVETAGVDRVGNQIAEQVVEAVGVERSAVIGVVEIDREHDVFARESVGKEPLHLEHGVAATRGPSDLDTVLGGEADRGPGPSGGCSFHLAAPCETQPGTAPAHPSHHQGS